MRIEGYAEKASLTESVEYFDSRPKASRIGAIVSQQSTVIADRKVACSSINVLVIVVLGNN